MLIIRLKFTSCIRVQNKANILNSHKASKRILIVPTAIAKGSMRIAHLTGAATVPDTIESPCSLTYQVTSVCVCVCVWESEIITVIWRKYRDFSDRETGPRQGLGGSRLPVALGRGTECGDEGANNSRGSGELSRSDSSH